MSRETLFSPCRSYRYTLWREWAAGDLFGESKPLEYLMVVGLNPSTADETKDDNTIRRCVNFAKQWGYGALCMTNLFAWRETSPWVMRIQADPVGPENNDHLLETAKGAGCILAAWGNHGAFKKRDRKVLSLLAAHRLDDRLQCLAYNADGSPMHPLYTPKDSPRLPWPKPKEVGGPGGI